MIGAALASGQATIVTRLWSNAGMNPAGANERTANSSDSRIAQSARVGPEADLIGGIDAN